ncbi:hypothetical protein G6720_03815 [Polynucleobacter paneuropaeus]|nr:hypothetical protein G6720_03815 [Polynucleobacter paneuropaeus]
MNENPPNISDDVAWGIVKAVLIIGIPCVLVYAGYAILSLFFPDWLLIFFTLILIISLGGASSKITKSSVTDSNPKKEDTGITHSKDVVDRKAERKVIMDRLRAELAKDRDFMKGD